MTTAWEQAYLALRRCLADGTYPPGAHLREEDLATQLGVSRTPIREALRRLDAEGWLRVVPNQGAFAAEWSLPEMVEIFDLRGMLEAHAAEHAAMAPSPQGIAGLRAACEAGEAAMPGANLADATATLVRLQRDLTKHVFLHGATRSFITFSAGITLVLEDDPMANAIGRADEAMYRAKREGKNCVCTG